VTVLVDPAVWRHRDRRWCHLASDRDLAELHEFAARVGLPPRAFHGDHYDVPDEWRPDMIAAGAVEVTARELLHALRRAGLRLSPAARRATDSPGRAGPAGG
jgi:hypothetical protein